MSKYIDAEKLIAEIERRISIKENLVQRPEMSDLKESLYDIIRAYQSLKTFIASLQQEQPMPDSTKLIELWHEDKEMLKEKDFRDDPWRLAYNAFMCGFGRGIEVNKQEQPAMIQWTGNNLKEVIDFTGKSPRFEEWFKSWDEFESYVHSHGDILKIFSEDGSHFEVPVGAWIVKTPDGYNVPSIARFIHAKQEQPEFVNEIWHKVSEEANLTRPVVLSDGDKYMSPPCTFPFKDMSGFVNAMNKKYKADYTIWAYMDDLLNISSLQREQPEVDLNEEIDRFLKSEDSTTYENAGPYKVAIKDPKKIARHFYELGQRTKYQQDRGEFAKLKAKEWQEGYDEGYAHGLNARKEE